MPFMTAPDPKQASPSGVDQYRLLLEASRRLSAELSPGELYEAIYQETAKSLSAPGFYLAIHDQGRDLARIVYRAEEGTGQHTDVPYRGSDSQVISTRQSALFDGEVNNAALSALGDDAEAGVRSGVTAPLLHGGRVLGVIGAHSTEEGAYDESDLEVLEHLAEVAAVAIHNAQLFAELDRRRREAEKLEEIGRALTSNLDSDQVVGLIISAVSEVLDVDGVAVSLNDPHREGHCRVADSGGEFALPVGLEWELTGGVLERLVHHREPVMIDNLAASSDLPDELSAFVREGSSVGVPLVLDDRVQGILTAGSRHTRWFSPDDMSVLQRLANQACVALANARLHSNLHALSLTDPLTGLPNRRRLQIHLEHEVAAARRGRPMSIAVFDLDKFKHYNDTFGHIAGDDILKAVASVLANENRAMNVVARYGGDEFVSVLSETGLEGARHFVDRVKKGIAENETLAKFGITISIGAAEFDPESMASVNDVLRAADADMYAAKAVRHAEIAEED